MKKIVLIILSLLALAPCRGQDTITENASCYIFWPHSNTLWLPNTNYRLSYAYSFIWENIASPGTLIYGVSLRGSFPLDSTVSVILAVKETDSIYLCYDTVWLDSSVVYRYFKFRAIDNEGNQFNYGENCNEIYFHRPWPVPDTFHIVIQAEAYSYYSCLGIKTKNDTIFPQRWCQMNHFNGAPPYFPPLTNQNLSPSPWGHEFPILEPNRRRCHKPTGVRPLERGDDWVVVGWDGGAGDSYRVTVEGPTDTLVLTTADTAVRLDSLLPDVLYWVEVQSLCRYQYGDYDSTFLNPGSTRLGVRVFGAGVTGTDADPQVDIYPNPASDRIVLVTGGDTPVRATLMDLAGREITTVDFHTTTTLDVSLLPRGSYLLRLTTPAGTVTRKILLQ